jgi:hypothetical protein
LLTLLSACQTVASIGPPTARANAAGPTSVDSLLQFAESLPAMSEGELGEELASIAAEPLEEISAAEAIQLALLHVEGRPRLANPAQARRALEAIVMRSDEDPDLVTLAELLLDFYRAGTTAARDESALFVAYPMRLDDTDAEAQRENNDLRGALADERRHRQVLERQLEALRALEAALDETQ